MPTATNFAELDTRTRILRAALRLFRKHGYHGVGITEILELAQAPKGSMYHHFPDGKEEIGVAVIEEITRGLLAMFEASRTRSTAALITQVGENLAVVMQKTANEVCALFSAFMAERNTSPQLAQAVARAYAQMIDLLAARLETEGTQKRQARELATVIVALLEGGALLSQAQNNQAAFLLAVKQAAGLCKLES
jgi:TetR/AcrR family transcriptional regulator, lmrAB and yxaGH operons repressor